MLRVWTPASSPIPSPVTSQNPADWRRSTSNGAFRQPAAEHSATAETRNALLADSQPCRIPATSGGTAR